MLDTHCQKNLIINGRELKYKGIFRANELFSAVNKALEERGYHKREKKTEELVTTAGRKTVVELRPYKEKTNYLTLMIKIRMTLDNVRETVEEIEGQRKKFEQGDINIIFYAWSLMDEEERWRMKPWVYFLKGFINKFIYTFPLEAGAIGELVGDTAYIYRRVNKLLQSYRGEIGKVPVEEEVRKRVEEEMRKEGGK